MGEDTTANRPSQVTVAGWGVIVAAAMLVFSIIDGVGNLNSVQMRDQLQEVLATGSDGLGISLDIALEWVRVVLYVSAAAAATAAILGVYVLRRDRGARIGLTVATVPIVLGAPFAGGFLAAIVAASTAMLWTGPARDWFAGRPVRQTNAFLGGARTSREAQDRTAQRVPPRDEPPAFVPPPRAHEHSGEEGAGDGPAPSQGFGARPGAAPAWGPGPGEGTGGQPAGWQSGGQPPAWQSGPASYPSWPQPYDGRSRLDDRPRVVRTACIVAAVFTGITLAAALVLAAVLAVQSDTVIGELTSMPEWQDTGLQDSLLLPALWTWVVVLLVWCPTVLTLIWFTWRRSNGARITLIVSAAIAGVVGVLGFPVSIGHLVASAVTIGMLVSQPARAWFAGAGQGPRQGPRQGPPGPPPGPRHGPPPGNPYDQHGQGPTEGPAPSRPADRPHVW